MNDSLDQPKRRRGRPAQGDTRRQHVAVKLSDKQLAFCEEQARARGLMGRGHRAHLPAPNRFIAALVEEARRKEDAIENDAP